jgi:FkbM family methyltransferase
VQDRLDVLKIDLHVLSQKLDIFSQELHTFRQSTEMILYALHEKFDEARQEAQQRSEQAQDRIEQIAEITQPTRSMVEDALAKIDELALRLRVPVQIDEFTFSLRTSDGFVLVPRSDPVLLLKLLEAGPKGPEPGTRAILTKLLRPGMTFIDIGARVGLYTLAGAGAVGPKGKVLALEPMPKMFELLNRAIFFNGFAARVVTKCVAAGDRRQRTARPVMGGEPALGDRAQNEPETIEMDVWPLDELVAPGVSVDLVKINFEAAMPSVLKGMTRIIQENPDLAIIGKINPASLREIGVSSEGWLANFEAYGFHAYRIDEESGEYRHVVSSELTDTASVNVAFIRPSSLAMSRVF